ncbi:MAG: hypothetical protein II683_06260, partial [Muribaculaceae bacterium]|nr:hypothetical protein [Muribaculaceae bacterium]
MLKRTLLTLCAALLSCAVATAQNAKTENPKSPPPPPRPDGMTNRWTKDSMNLRFDVNDKLSQSYEDLQFVQSPTDLKNPSNITTTAEYDYETGHYVIHTKIGDNDIMTPFLLTPEEYENIALRQSMQEYYRQKNSE